MLEVREVILVSQLPETRILAGELNVQDRRVVARVIEAIGQVQVLRGHEVILSQWRRTAPLLGAG